ncbi:MAG: hypothetical protein JWP44_4987 [Mucilaginibacter sp.]|nr:hypothetical protein [Mucilaginibacter sp.]
MKILHIIGGVASLALGLYIIIRQVKIFFKGQQDNLGFSIKLLAGGIASLILGIALLSEYLVN